MELQVGQYIRTHNGISKIIKFGGDKARQEKKDTLITDVTITFSSLVEKASFNKIDLIKESDVLEVFYRITDYIVDVYKYEDTEKLCVCLEGQVVYLDDEELIFKSIVTKEQFQSAEYKFEEAE